MINDFFRTLHRAQTAGLDFGDVTADHLKHAYHVLEEVQPPRRPELAERALWALEELVRELAKDAESYLKEVE